MTTHMHGWLQAALSHSRTLTHAFVCAQPTQAMTARMHGLVAGKLGVDATAAVDEVEEAGEAEENGEGATEEAEEGAKVTIAYSSRLCRRQLEGR